MTETISQIPEKGAIAYYRNADGTYSPLAATDIAKSEAIRLLLEPVIPRAVASFNRPADATQYTDGDLIANSGTAGSVVPLTFTMPIMTGKVTGCRCTISPASGNLVIAACDFDLLLFRAEANLPFAAGGYPADNAALVVTGPAQEELVGILQFTNGNWRAGTGSLTSAGITGYQRGAIMSAAPFFPFNIVAAADATKLLGIVQARGAWNPGNIVNRMHFALDVVP